jgi:hypothetical protein
MMLKKCFSIFFKLHLIILKQAQIYDIFLRQARVAQENGQADEASYCKANISSSK